MSSDTRLTNCQEVLGEYSEKLNRNFKLFKLFLDPLFYYKHFEKCVNKQWVIKLKYYYFLQIFPSALLKSGSKQVIKIVFSKQMNTLSNRLTDIDNFRIVGIRNKFYLDFFSRQFFESNWWDFLY